MQSNFLIKQNQNHFNKIGKKKSNQKKHTRNISSIKVSNGCVKSPKYFFFIFFKMYLLAVYNDKRIAVIRCYVIT